MSLDPLALKKQFPLLAERQINGAPIVYLDSANTSQNLMRARVIAQADRFLKEQPVTVTAEQPAPAAYDPVALAQKYVFSGKPIPGR